MAVESEVMHPGNLKIKDKDFYAKFDGGKWSVEWFFEGKLLEKNSGFLCCLLTHNL